MSENEGHIDSVLEEVVEDRRVGRPDAPNQNVVRPDGSGPGSPPDGTGGSTRPQQRGGTPEEQEVRAQAAEQAAPAGKAGLDEMTKEELLDYARSRDISPANGGMTKDELRASIDEAEG